MDKIKDFLKAITWGKFDSNSILHTVLGAGLFFGNLQALGLRNWQAFWVTLQISTLWEFCQWKYKNAPFDVKDIVLSIIIGFIFCLLKPII